MKIINVFFDTIKNLDIKFKKLMYNGLLLSFALCLISSIILFTYQFIYEIPNLYYIGISLFKSSIMFGCVFVMCTIGFDTIKNEIA